MRKKRKRWISFLWGASYEGDLIDDLIMSPFKDDIKLAITTKSNSKSYHQAVARGWEVVRVRRTLSIEK